MIGSIYTFVADIDKAGYTYSWDFKKGNAAETKGIVGDTKKRILKIDAKKLTAANDYKLTVTATVGGKSKTSEVLTFTVVA